MLAAAMDVHAARSALNRIVSESLCAFKVPASNICTSTVVWHTMRTLPTHQLPWGSALQLLIPTYDRAEPRCRLQVDGIVGPDTKDALYSSAPSGPAPSGGGNLATVLSAARAEIG